MPAARRLHRAAVRRSVGRGRRRRGRAAGAERLAAAERRPRTSAHCSAQPARRAAPDESHRCGRRRPRRPACPVPLSTSTEVPIGRRMPRTPTSMPRITVTVPRTGSGKRQACRIVVETERRRCAGSGRPRSASAGCDAAATARRRGPAGCRPARRSGARHRGSPERCSSSASRRRSKVALERAFGIGPLTVQAELTRQQRRHRRPLDAGPVHVACREELASSPTRSLATDTSSAPGSKTCNTSPRRTSNAGSACVGQAAQAVVTYSSDTSITRAVNAFDAASTRPGNERRLRRARRASRVGHAGRAGPLPRNPARRQPTPPSPTPGRGNIDRRPIQRGAAEDRVIR